MTQQENETMRPDLSTAEAAALANVSRKVIRRAVQFGELDAYSTAGVGQKPCFRIPWKSFEKWRTDRINALKAEYAQRNPILS